jgi:hypothetical protein
VRFLHELMALGVFLADVEQTDARIVDAEHVARDDRAHGRELRELQRRGLGIGPEVEDMGVAAITRRHRGHDRSALDRTDGFTGNVALKAMEGLAKLIGEQLRTEFTRDLTSKLSGLLARRVLRRVGDKLDPRRYNGACMVGLTAVVVKSHGSADRVAFAQAVATAATAMRRGLPAAIASALANRSG